MEAAEEHVKAGELVEAGGKPGGAAEQMAGGAAEPMAGGYHEFLAKTEYGPLPQVHPEAKASPRDGGLRGIFLTSWTD